MLHFLVFNSTTICRTCTVMAVISAAVCLYILERQAPIPNTLLKNRETAIFSFNEKIYPVLNAGQNSKLKTEIKSQTVLQCLFSVQQVFRTGVNTSLKKYQQISNRLQTTNLRCSGVYPVLAIEQ